MVSKGNREILVLPEGVYFYSLPFYLKFFTFIILLILMFFSVWSGIGLIEGGSDLLGYAVVLTAFFFLIVTFFLIFMNRSFGRYFGLDVDGMYFNNYKDKKKWLFVPWDNIFHVKKEKYYASRKYVIEIFLLSNRYEMTHYFRVNDDPFWNENSGRIKVAYSRIPFKTDELLSLVRMHCNKHS